MSILSLGSTKNNVKKNRYFEKTVEALTSALSQELSEESDFAQFEQTLLELCNDASKRILSKRLENIARKYNGDYLLIGGVRYKRHELGAVEYHSLCGSMKIERYTYRQADVRTKDLSHLFRYLALPDLM